MKGYKVFNPDWTCRGFQYEVGQTYEMEGDPECCKHGFHFCLNAADCFEFYKFDSANKVAEVEALGEVAEKAGEENSKRCTNKIRIVRELTWHEVLDLVNLGKDCTGLRNSGNFNSGDRNSGDFNKASNCVGCFNTENKPLFFFDKPTDWTLDDWYRSDACELMSGIDFRPTGWIWFNDMTDEEKKQNPTAESTGGYLKILDNSDCFKEWWNGLGDDEKAVIKGIPNFDADKFFEITGIRVEED